MIKVLTHRGPDDTGAFIENNAALGVTRLSIIDLAGGHQPIHNEDKTIWLACNGEIYNFMELREYLSKKGHIFYTKTDTEVIVHLYEEYGHDSLNKLKGMFAFAVFDQKKKELFIARDRFGIKPLYYCADGSQLIFASEIKSILQFPGFKRELDLAALDQYLTFEYVPSPRSIFKNIKKLPAAHYLVYREKNINVSKYWDIGFPQIRASVDKKDAKEKLAGLLNTVIKRHLVSDVPLGVFLSGGIDSSTITALSSRLSNNGIKTFSIGFKEDSFDESEYALKVSGLYNTEHYHRIFEINDLLRIIPKAAYYLDEPLADASFFPTYLLSNFARQKVTVALSGEGGDEIFAGYPTYQAHKLAGFYKYIPAYIRNNLINKVINKLPVSTDNFSLDFKAKKFVSSLLSDALLRHIYWMGSFNLQDKIALYSSSPKEALMADNPDDLLKPYRIYSKNHCELDLYQYLDIKTYLQDDLLVKADRASMANSLEVRVPYLDHELAEFAFSLPPSLRLKNLNTKYILKETAGDLLPQDIINRQKKGFGAPIAAWIKDGFKEVILDNLAKDKIKKEGFFNYSYIERLLKEHFDNKADNRKKIWTIFMFELWLKEYFYN
jgi:asparagine synthase (glutamine-hydrolysing)